MVRLFSKYENGHKFQRQWKHHFDTSPALAMIMAVNQRFSKTGSVEDLPRTSRTVTVLTEKSIQNMVDTNPRLSIRQGFIQAAISAGQYHAVIQKLQLEPYHPTLIVDLNEDDFDTHSQSSEIRL